MNKQNTEVPSHFSNYSIPHLKNKITRTLFQQNANSWLMTKLGNIAAQSNLSKQHQIQSNNNQSIIKTCESIQKQFRLKYSISNLLPSLPFQYFETIILYVMEKKLFWIYKSQDNSQTQQLQKHHEIEISLNFKLKNLYKDFQYNNYQLKKAWSSVKQEKFYFENTTNSFNSTKFTTKKVDPDFQFNLLLILSVSIVSAFFKHFFTQLQIDNLFRSEIYIILNHAFLDLQVSPNVYEILRKKFIFQDKVKEYQGLNLSQINEKSIIQSKKGGLQKSLSRKENIFENSSNLCPTQGKPTLQKIENPSKGQLSNRQTKQMNKKEVSIHRMNSTTGFSSFESHNMISKKNLAIKPTFSVDNPVSMKNSNQKISRLKTKNSLNRDKPNYSRFNSFLRDARQFSVPTILKETFGQKYLPTPQVIDFYSTIKKCLHVDSLPPIVKKKMNINQYQKLIQLNDLQEIRREVNSLDIQSKKNHMKSNDLSLTMNTFISTSSKIPKKKRHQTNIQIMQNIMIDQQQEQTSQLNDLEEQKDKNVQKNQFQKRKLPVKASNLKLPYQKSSKIYQFTDQISQNDTKRSKKQYQFLYGKYELLSNKKQTDVHNDQQEQREMQRSLQQKKKKSPCEWKNYLNLLKKHQSKENIASFVKDEQKKSEKKKTLTRKSYLRQQQQDKKLHYSTQNSLHNSSKQIKLKNQSTIIPKQSILMNKEKQSYQSMNVSTVNLKNFQQPLQKLVKKQSNKVGELQMVEKDIDPYENQEISKYSSLEGQVNVHNEAQEANIQRYDSFELRKRFKQFQNNCKLRDQKISYSVFNINPFKNLKI